VLQVSSAEVPSDAGWSRLHHTALDHDPGWQVVRITFVDRVDLDRLAGRLDVWEVHHEAGYIVARVTRAEYSWLLSEGYAVTVDERSMQINAPPGYPCYRTISQLYADEDAFASTYPTLTQVITVGWSYEGRPLRILKLTNENHPVPDKPRLFLMANIHGREFITPETAMQFVKLLLEGYGHDADTTWMLDWREIYILVSANPDGHAHNEANFSYWRKNANPADQSSCPSSYGADLNRNSSFQWGGAGASSYACSETYRGPSAASELETQAIQSFVTTLFPDQRGPLITDTAPVTTSGILISLHSYGNLVLWPWGFTYDASPNSAQLAQLGQKLASYNGYSPQPASGLYLASGTTDDWSYGELGIASYTFEMGGGGDGFLPTCDRYDALIQSNLGALKYAVRVAREPYQLSFGPDAISLTITTSSGTANITATITSNQIISAAQAYVDTPPWVGGTPLPMVAINGMFNQTAETVTTTLSLANLDFGRHIAFVRGQDVSGNWGPVSAVFINVPLPHNMYLPLVAHP
jgi:hypothetical protein